MHESMENESRTQLDYEQIMARLDEVVGKIETPELPLKELEPLLKQAKELIAQARKQLEGYRTDFEKALEQ